MLVGAIIGNAGGEEYAVPPGEIPALPSAEHGPSPGVARDGDEIRSMIQSAAERSWLYRQSVDARGRHTFVRLANEAWRYAAEAASGSLWLVTEGPDLARRRARVETREDVESVFQPGAAAPGVWCRITCVGHDTGARLVAASLLCANGLPFGELDGNGWAHLRVPFAGFVRAEGYVPEVVRVDALLPNARVELRRAAWVRGRITGAATEGDVLLVLGEDGRMGDCVELDGPQRFELGPIQVGNALLDVRSSSGYLADANGRIQLIAGFNEVGDVRIEPMQALAFRVFPAPASG